MNFKNVEAVVEKDIRKNKYYCNNMRCDVEFRIRALF